ncbi:MAG: chromate transporter [Oscillospiraceae bacterium]|nr:chromate transporter [Oscillospiraceae bacterium]
MIYLRLYWEFFKTGLFSVGGGLATLPFLYEMGEKTGWFTTAQVADMLAVSESTPGGIGVNMATYAGYTACGIPGGIVATLGLATPSILIILVIAMMLDRFRKSPYVDAAFYALRPTSTGLIAAAGFSVFVLVLFNGAATSLLGHVRWGALALGALLWLLTNKVKLTKKLHPIVFIALAAAAGVVFRLGGA